MNLGNAFQKYLFSQVSFQFTCLFSVILVVLSSIKQYWSFRVRLSTRREIKLIDETWFAKIDVGTAEYGFRKVKKTVYLEDTIGVTNCLPAESSVWEEISRRNYIAIAG